MQHKGLSFSQVIENRNKYGENVLTPPKKQSTFSLFLEKFEDPIIRILLIALLLSFGVAFYEYFSLDKGLKVFFEPIGILVAILLATLVGFFFELSAAKKFDILTKVNDESLVTVLRDDIVTEISKKDIVVGDIVILKTGDEIPADGLLLEAISLQIDESTLTGEPIAKKTTNPEHFSKVATYPSNEVLKGTSVASGTGTFVVRQVGDNTEYGKVYVGSQIDTKTKTPLNKQLEKLGTVISYASYSVALAIIVIRSVLYFSSTSNLELFDALAYMLDTLMIAVTLVVVSIPEGLPMSVTLSLALSMRRMLSTNNLVRKMHACETMGATTVICTDKTGTLTENQMRVYKDEFEVLNDFVFEGISVNSSAFLDFSDTSKIKTIGNPTEGALLLWLNSQGKDYKNIRQDAELVDQLAFSTERKYMATIVKSAVEQGKQVLYVKGAPEIVFAMTKQSSDSKLEKEISDKLFSYQSQAMRTLGFAYKILDNNQTELFKEDKLSLKDLNFLGIVAISDPVRSDVPQAIKKCISAGIDVKIVTGDTPATAKEIGRQIGLWTTASTESMSLTGAEFSELSDKDLLDRILDLKILSRAKPMDKERLVRLLQQKKQVVAVTGDGTNDAPALNVAEVGLSMGDGTSVAKQASDITIMDNSFASIVKAVMWGRSLYKNIQKFILFQLTINVVACLIVLIGAFLSVESPLTVTQMLWVNLIMDTFAALALASLPPSEDVLEERPRKTKDHILSKPMIFRIVGVGLIFVALLFGILQWFKYEDVTSLRQFAFSDFFSNYFNFSSLNQTEGGLSKYELSMFFTFFVMMQFWNLFNAKTFGSKFSRHKNKTAFAGGFYLVLLLILLGQILIVSIGGKMFNVVPIGLNDWIRIIVSTSLIFIIGSIFRVFSNLKKVKY